MAEDGRNGKGSLRRKAQVSPEVEAARWAALQVACPRCGQLLMRRQPGRQTCWRCGAHWIELETK